MDNERSLTFTGTHYEIGQQIGVQYRRWGKNKLYTPVISASHYQQQLAIYQTYYPEYLRLLQGVAQGGDYNPDDVIKSYTAGFLDLTARPRNACSVIGLNRDGRVFIGRNYDWCESAEQSARRISMNFSGEASSFVAMTDMGVWKKNTSVGQHEYVIDTEDAQNEHGLFVCLNGAPGVSASLGMSSTHIVQAAAEQCKTTAQAVDLICNIPCNDPKSFTIIDKTGDMAVVEKQTDKAPAVVRSRDSLIVTNHYQSAQYAQDNLSIFRYVPFHSSFARHAYLELQRDVLERPSLEALRSIMLQPPVIQNWRGQANGDMVTVWVQLIELTGGETEVVYNPQKASLKRQIPTLKPT